MDSQSRRLLLIDALGLALQVLLDLTSSISKYINKRIKERLTVADILFVND